MYVAAVLLLMFIMPAVSVAVEFVHSPHAVNLLALVGKWYVFWGVGVRLFTVGVRQVLQPQFTAREIFGIQDRASLPIVRELGFANLSMGALGICTLVWAGWTVPSAFVGGLYYGFAGAVHIPRKHRNAKENLAMASDGVAFLVLLVFVVSVLRPT